MKKCLKCNNEKNKSEFGKDKYKSDGLYSYCKSCANIKAKQYQESDNYKLWKKDYDKSYALREKVKDKRKKYRKLCKYKQYKSEYDKLYVQREDVMLRLFEYRKSYYSSDSVKDRVMRYNIEYRKSEKHKIGKKISSARYHKKHRDKIIKRYYDTPIEIHRAVKKKYRDNNREKYNIAQMKYRLRNKHLFAYRSLLTDFLRRSKQSKSDKTSNMLGYSYHQFKQRIEMNFKDGMNWDNHGLWHIDHKKPISKFKKGTSSRIVNMLSNLQPLWAFDNLSKGNKF